MKKSNGITLIPLIASIIILLILAGISIHFLIGSNSVINKMVFSKEEHTIQEIREELNVELQNIISDNVEKGINNSQAQSLTDFQKKHYIAVKKNDKYCIYYQGKYRFEIEEKSNGDQEVVFKAKEFFVPNSIAQLSFINQTLTTTYNENSHDIEFKGAEDGSGTYTYTVNESDSYIENISGTTITLKASTPAKTYKYTVKAEDESGATAEREITIIVAKADGSGSVSMDGWTYGETASNPSPTSTTNGTNNVTYKYKVSTAADSTYTENKPTNAGEYTVQATFAETDNYNKTTATANFTIAKANSMNPTLTDNTTETYNEGKHYIGVSGGNGGIIKYQTSNDNSTWVDWTKSGVPYLINAGTLYVRAYVEGNGNYKGTDESNAVTGTITVNKKAIQVTSEDGVADYDETEKTFAISVTEPQSGCTIYYKEGATALTENNYTNGTTTTKPTRTNAGTTTVQWYVHTENGNYSDVSGNNTITVNKLAATNPTLTDTTATYDGEAHEIGVSGGSGGTINYRTSTDGSTWGDWSTTKPSLKNAGTLYVQAYVVGDGNHNDTDKTKPVTGTITINKATLAAPSVSISTEDGKVTWNSVTGATGYEISFNNEIWIENVTSGSRSIITETEGTGQKTVYVKAISTNSNYKTPSESGSASATVCSLTLDKVTGIDSVTGAGRYVRGKTVTLGATASTGYTWSTWTVIGEGDTPTAVTTAGTTVTITQDTKLKATATANTYTINYELDGGNVSSNPTIYTTDSDDITLNNPTKTGYTFIGWKDEQDGIVKKDDISMPYTMNNTMSGNTFNNTKLQIWTTSGTHIGQIGNYGTTGHYQGSYTFNNDTGTYMLRLGANGSKQDKTVYFYANLTKGIKYNFEWDVVEFSGSKIVIDNFRFYKDGGNNTSVPVHIIKNGSYGNKTLIATWTANEYTVTYNYNGATGGNSSENKKVTYGNTYGELPEPTKTGYTFGGWYKDSEFTNANKVETTTAVSTANDHTIYAKWTANKYTVTYNFNGATGGNTPSSNTVTYGSTYGELPEPTKTGYTFSGWFKDSECTTANKVVSTTSVATASNHTLYAKWTETTYTITYNAGGGSGTMADSTQYKINSVVNLKDNSYTRDYYLFNGWKDQDGNSYANKATVTIKKNLILTAQWKLKEYYVTMTFHGSLWYGRDRKSKL